MCTCTHDIVYSYIDPLKSEDRIDLWKPPQLCSTHILTGKLISNDHLINVYNLISAHKEYPHNSYHVGHLLAVHQS